MALIILVGMHAGLPDIAIDACAEHQAHFLRESWTGDDNVRSFCSTKEGKEENPTAPGECINRSVPSCSIISSFFLLLS